MRPGRVRELKKRRTLLPIPSIFGSESGLIKRVVSDSRAKFFSRRLLPAGRGVLRSDRSVANGGGGRNGFDGTGQAAVSFRTAVREHIQNKLAFFSEREIRRRFSLHVRGSCRHGRKTSLRKSSRLAEGVPGSVVQASTVSADFQAMATSSAWDSSTISPCRRQLLH
jgi:hypothetical protein